MTVVYRVAGCSKLGRNRLPGSAVNYNRVRFNAPISIPISAGLLAWHVVARPWEAVAFAPELLTADGRRATAAEPLS